MRCLVVMHNPLSKKTNNGKTVASLLSEFKREDLAQIFLTNLEPDYDICDNYYILEEKSLITSKFAKEGPGRKLTFSKVRSETPISKSHGSANSKWSLKVMKRLSRNGFVLFLRNILWRRNAWYSRELENWVHSFKPDCIFFLPGYIYGLFDCVNYFSDVERIPIITFVTDDYFLVHKKGGLFNRIVNNNLHKKYAELMERSNVHYVISEQMAEKYSEEFKCSNIIMMNSVDEKLFYGYKSINRDNIKVLYVGNLGLDRLSVILTLAEAITTLNESNIANISLDIISATILSQKEVKAITTNPNCFFRGPLYGEELEKEIRESDILLYVESFDNKYKSLLETAVSTKIPEYMMSGRLLLGIGPKYSAAIQYIEKNNVGVIISNNSQDVIAASLTECILNLDKNTDITRRALDIAKHSHSLKNNSRRVYMDIKHEVEGYKQ